MQDRVHLLTPALDHERFSRPLNRGEHAADKVMLVRPPDDHPFPSRASERLVDSLKRFGIDHQSTTVAPTPLPKAVDQIYELVLDELSKGNRVYVNVCSGYHQLGSAAVIAASHVISDSVFGPEGSDAAGIDGGRSQVHFYSTEPEEYHFDELIDSRQTVQSALQPERVDMLQENADSLADRVKRDRDTVRRLNALLEADIGAVAEQFGLLDDPELAEAVDSLEKFVEGVTTTIEAMNELAENRETIEGMFQTFPIEEPTGGVFDLMEDVKEDDEPLEPTELFNYFENRLDTINQITNDAQALGNSRSELLDKEGDEPNIFETFENKGIASGVRQFNKTESSESPSSILKHPGPLEEDVRPTERALIYTLWETGSADSVRQFTHSVAQQVVANAAASGVELPESDQVSALQDGKPSNDGNSHLISSIQSTVQYNLTKLDEKGFIRRVRKGSREKTIEFTRAGEIYAATREFDEQWLGQAFEDLADSIEDALIAKE